VNTAALDGQLLFYRGRVALYSILNALGIGTGDEVALQAFTCVAVPEAILASGARPIYVDIEPNGWNMDANDLAAKISSRTRAVVVQHTFGIPADLRRIGRIATAAGLPIIEDCCHTMASMYEGQPIGSFGMASFYSFEWGKPLVVGIGGGVTVNDEELRKRLLQQYSSYTFPPKADQRLLTLQYLAHRVLYRPSLYWPVRGLYHLLSRLGAARGNYNPVRAGSVADDFSFRMSTPLQSRLAVKQRDLQPSTHHSRRITDEYRSKISSSLLLHPAIPDQTNVVFARYPLVTDEKLRILTAARKANVELADWYLTPVHPIPAHAGETVGYQFGSCPNAEVRCKQVVSLPTHAAVTSRDVDRAVSLLNSMA